MSSAINVQVENGCQLATQSGSYVQVELEEIPFREWVNTEMSLDNPDFSFSRVLSPKLGRRFVGDELEKVRIAGMDFPSVCGITAAEESFVDWMNTKIQNNQSKTNALIVGLARRLRSFDEACDHSTTCYEALIGDTSDEKTWKIGEIVSCTIVTSDKYPGIRSEIWRNSKDLILSKVMVPEEDVKVLKAEHDAKILSVAGSRDLIYNVLNGRGGNLYEIFSDEESESINAIFKIANSSVSQKFQDLLKISFMIAHRVNPNWRMSESFELLASEVSKMIDFWAKEKNGGITPELVTGKPAPAPAPSDADAKIAEEEALNPSQKKDSNSLG